ncbi:MAG TPA: anti-sigma factor [Actinocrinis sp.]|nr:anti-sigma factor [Actinocrinis sp.]
MSMNAMPDVHALTGAYVCDALDPTEREAFEEHLAQCTACGQEVAELREVAAVLARAAALEPPARLKAAVDARIAVSRQLPPEVGAGAQVTPIGEAPSRRRARGVAAWAGWAAAAALAGVAVGLGVHTASQQRQINSLSQQAGVMQQLLSAPDKRSASAEVRTGGTATVLDSRSRDEAVISFAGLAAPPPGKAYQLWMMGPSGARSGGLLALPTTGNPNPVVAHGLGDAQTIGLTVEPARGSAQPTSTPILLLPMS